MAFSFVVEDGSGLANANSYASVEDGDDYHKGRLFSETWQNTSQSTREAVLVHATRLLDQHMDWLGAPASVDQALLWPRVGVRHRNGYKLIANDEIPQWLKDATAELARYLIAEDREAEEDTLGFSKIKAGSVEIEIDKEDRKGVLPRSVLSIVSPYGFTSQQGSTIKLARS